MSLIVPIAILEIVGGAGLITLSISRRWVNWLSGKGSGAYWFVQYLILWVAVWGIFKGITQLLRLLEAK